MYTAPDKVESVINLLVEGCPIRSIQRLTGIDQNTIMKILVLAGDRCERLLESKCRGVPVSDVQCDEIWGFVGCKEKHNQTGNPEFGDAYCFVAIERTSKLVLTWHLGRRTARDTMAFTEKLHEATAGKFQVTTDGFGPYFDAIHTSLGTRVDYAQLIKIYAAPSDEEHRYSPASVIDAIVKTVWASPTPTESARHMSRGRILRCGCRFAGGIASPTVSRRSERTCGPLSPCISLGTISAGHTGRSVAPQRWNRSSQTMCGPFQR